MRGSISVSDLIKPIWSRLKAPPTGVEKVRPNRLGLGNEGRACTDKQGERGRSGGNHHALACDSWSRGGGFTPKCSGLGNVGRA